MHFKPKQDNQAQYSGIPALVHLIYLNKVSAEDAKEYALGFMHNKVIARRLSYGVFAHGEGFVVEIHEGGLGLAYFPNIINALQSNPDVPEVLSVRALLPTGTGSLYVTCTSLRLDAMVIPEGTELTHDLEVKPSATPLTHVSFDQSEKLKKSTGKLFGASLLVYALAMVLSPSAPSIVISSPEPSALPLTHWVDHQSWPANKTPVTMVLDSKTKEYKLVTIDTKKAAEHE